MNLTTPDILGVLISTGWTLRVIDLQAHLGEFWSAGIGMPRNTWPSRLFAVCKSTVMQL
jgi:hypothetical protein